MYHRCVCSVPAVSSPRTLGVGESITPYDAIQLSLGASWSLGLYSDMANRSYYVCNGSIVVVVFPWDQLMQATQEYGRRVIGEKRLLRIILRLQPDGKVFLYQSNDSQRASEFPDSKAARVYLEANHATCEVRSPYTGHDDRISGTYHFKPTNPFKGGVLEAEL